MAGSSPLASPHRGITPNDAREVFALRLLDTLWINYRDRVSYVRDYEEVVNEAGGTFENDHIAFRTLASQDPLTGIATLSRIFEALGYEPAGCYVFPDEQIRSIHFEHSHPRFPKLFVSELRVWEYEPSIRDTIWSYTQQNATNVDNADLTVIHALKGRSVATRIEDHEQILQTFSRRFFHRPWQAPERADLEAINKVSQFAAWVLVHGYAVNHFTALVNSHGVTALDDIEKTVAALQDYGVPMKASIEGNRGSKLRQSATNAVKIDVPLRENGQETSASWTYAYFEIAERGNVIDPNTGQHSRFEGFLGPQAAQLFEMTRVGN